MEWSSSEPNQQPEHKANAVKQATPAIFLCEFIFVSFLVLVEKSIYHLCRLFQIVARRFDIINTTLDLARSRLDRIAKALDFCYSEARKDSNHRTLDAMLVAGDVTNDGYDEQFDAFAGVIKSSLKEETDLLAIVARNHDGYQGKSCRDKISAISGDDADYHVVIGGFHFSKLPLDDTLKAYAERLDSYDTDYYTCHCTGTEQYDFMRRYMKRLHYLSTGERVEIK